MQDEKKADAKVIERIRKLLALANSPSEAEASQALTKAHAMLREYNLEAVDIAEPSEVIKEVVEEGTRQSTWKNYLLNGIALSCYCTMITNKGWDLYDYKLYGRPANVKSAILMYEYLCEVVAREATIAARVRRGLSRAEYAQGMALRLGERLVESMQVEESASTALVPVATEAHDAAVKDCNPKERSVTPKASASSLLGCRDAEDISLARQVRGAAL